MNGIYKFIELIIHILEESLLVFVEFLEQIIKGIKKKEGYHAKFASTDTLFSIDNAGFCLTGDKNLSVKKSYENALVVGGTGVGKSSVVLIPSLYSMRASYIVHDPSGELFTKTSGLLEKAGYEVKTLNFADPDRSAGYNPLTRAKSSTDVQKIASMIVDNALGGTGAKDPFWNTQAVALITLLIQILKKQPDPYHTFHNVRRLVSDMGGNHKAVDDLFSKYADDALFAEYKSFLSYDEKVLSSILATCKAALQIFNDPHVAKVTSIDSLDMHEFRKKPTVLYIRNSVADQKYYSILTSLFFEQFFSFVLSRFPDKDEQDIFFLIDEASSLRLPTLPLAVANVRKHRAGIMLLLQDFNQLVHNYGKHDAEAIKSNCFAKMYFTGQSLETTKELEQTLGKYEYQDEKKQKVVRPLMTSDEIRTMKVNEALLVCGHFQPIKARLTPYYKNDVYYSYSELPETRIETETLFFKETPVLNLHHAEEKKE